MNKVSIQMQTLYRRSAVGDDDQTGRELVELVRNALQRGRAPGAAVVFRENRMDIIPFGPLVRAKVHIGTFIAALTRAEVDDAAPPQCVGIVGRFNWKHKGKGTGVPVAMVFLEWPDGRWWHWRAALSTEGAEILEDTVIVHRAVDGYPKPNTLGGWWSLGRRRRLNIQLNRREPRSNAPVGPIQ